MIAITKYLVFSILIVIGTMGNSYASDSELFDNSRIRYSPPNSFGLGLGMAFGGVGISYDRALNKRITLTASIGDNSLASDLTYQFGAKVFLHKGKIWQTRITALYGTNTYVNTACEFFCLIRHYEQFEGFSFGIGQRFIIGGKGKHSIDLDLFLAVRPDKAKELVADTDAIFPNEPGMDLSIGYRYYF